VINLDLSWPQAAVAAAALGGACVAMRLSGRPRLAGAAVVAQEAGLLLGLFALWDLAGSFTVMGPGGALARSGWIWHFERVIGLPSEASLQRVFLPHPLLVQFFNLYYDSLHFPVLISCLVWLFVWHRDSYRRWRTTLVALTGLCLLIQLVPVAPPRMLPQAGMVDTAVLYHESVYTNVAGFNADQLSAMPSVHVGWAILIAVAVISTARTKWRWLALLYPMMTTLAVIVTANHFWLDGIVAGLLLVVVLAVQAGMRRACLRVSNVRYRSVRGSAQPLPEALECQPGGITPRTPGDLLVADDQAHALGQHGGKDYQLSGADDRAAQRLCVEDDAQLGAAQVGTVHLGPAEVSAAKLRAGEGTSSQRGIGEVDVPQHARVERDLSQARPAEVDRVELAPAKYHAPQFGAEHLGSGQRGQRDGDIQPVALGEVRAGQPDVAHPHVAKICPLQPTSGHRHPAERALEELRAWRVRLGHIEPVEQDRVVVLMRGQVSLVRAEVRRVRQVVQLGQVRHWRSASCRTLSPVRHHSASSSGSPPRNRSTSRASAASPASAPAGRAANGSSTT
jgi:hypothetical protein